MGFFRQEYWSGLPSPEDLPDSGINPASPVLAGRFFTTEPPGKLSLAWKRESKTQQHHLDCLSQSYLPVLGEQMSFSPFNLSATGFCDLLSNPVSLWGSPLSQQIMFQTGTHPCQQNWYIFTPYISSLSSRKQPWSFQRRDQSSFSLLTIVTAPVALLQVTRFCVSQTAVLDVAKPGLGSTHQKCSKANLLTLGCGEEKYSLSVGHY